MTGVGEAMTEVREEAMTGVGEGSSVSSVPVVSCDTVMRLVV
jgi:hypothetical protein